MWVQVSCEPIAVFACHCTICQTRSGSAFGTAMRIRASGFKIIKGTLKTFQRISDRGQVFTNSFCPECGTRIHHQPSRFPDVLSLKPGTLDDTRWLVPAMHGFVRSAQKWLIIPQDATSFEAAAIIRSV